MVRMKRVLSVGFLLMGFSFTVTQGLLAAILKVGSLLLVAALPTLAKVANSAGNG